MKKIEILPQAVVDRIAAGEVVQRPSSAVKELLENSLDAGATEIIVQTDGIDRIIVSDDGCGIDYIDLKLAAVRHATSKLRTAEDLNSIESFGFRGEALASISMVARLSIVSRTANQQVGFKLSYIDGTPSHDKPLPIARKVGTTIHVQDLFYNMPHRRLGKATDEYYSTLRSVQLYAIHYAASGVAFHCQRMNSTHSSSGGRVNNSTNNKTDLNTSNAVMQLRKQSVDSTVAVDNDDAALTTSSDLNEQKLNAKKQVIAQVYGSQLLPHLNEFSASLAVSGKNSKTNNTLDSIQNDNHDGNILQQNDSNFKEEFVYTCSGIVSSPSYHSIRGAGSSIQFLLFVNNRLVDGCPSIKRTIESVYNQFTKFKPFVYLSITVPPAEVDVNVHPTKREVALLNLEEICNHLSLTLKQHLSSQGESFSAGEPSNPANPYNKNDKKRKKIDIASNQTKESKQPPEEGKKTKISSQQQLTQPKAVPPNKLIRTSRGTQSGSLEPFLISTQPSTIEETTTGDDHSKHKPDCPLHNMSTSSNDSEVDFSVPGAFAKISSQCTCNRLLIDRSGSDQNSSEKDLLSPASMIRLPVQPLVRPRYRSPHPCSYNSIQSLRKRIETQTDTDIQRKLRSACFVGVVSHERSLIQCGEELIMINHYECLRELFYQLALNRFGSGESAVFDNDCNIDIVSVIGQLIQVEETMRDFASIDGKVAEDKQIIDKTNNTANDVVVDETNQAVAEQAAECLLDNADMIREYFSIVIEKTEDTMRNESDINGPKRIVLKSLPILLEGYQPSPHGIPLLLLRLATEVDWENEKQCFHDISHELAFYFAQLPSTEDHTSLIKHKVFPAITTLLQPSKQLIQNNFLTTVSTLSRLYKVFERC